MDKSVIALILGILSLVACGPFSAVPGMIIAKGEMNAIQQGRSPAHNMNKAKWGWYLSIAGLVISVLFTCLWMLLGGLSMAGGGGYY
ncbi:MAG: hypothetical protein R2729_00900 [Bryobacteraceae bacterium]